MAPKKKEFECQVCGKLFLRVPCYVERSIRNGSRFISCSKSCTNRVYKKLATGNRNPAWKGGVTRSKLTCPYCGKIFYARPHRIYCSEDCYSKALTWGALDSAIGKRNFKEYRKLAEKKLGRKLKEDEVVHHIDGDHTNNNLDNLEVMNEAEHTRLHVALRTKARKAIEMEKQTL